MTNVYQIALQELGTGRHLAMDGYFAVVPTGGYARTTLYDSADAALSGATQAINKGMINFRTAESVGNVDVYYATDKGYCGVIRNIGPGGVGNHFIDLQNLRQTMQIPLSATDLGAAAAEYMTGFRLVKDVPVLPWGMGVYVAAIDATETLLIGTDSTSGANDPNGFADLLSVGTLGFQFPKVGYGVGSNSVYVDITGATAEWTYGELFHPATTKAAVAEGTDSATNKNGMYFMIPHVPGIGGSTSAYTEQVTVTPSSGLDTFTGILCLPMQLPYVPVI